MKGDRDGREHGESQRVRIEGGEQREVGRGKTMKAGEEQRERERERVRGGEQ